MPSPSSRTSLPALEPSFVAALQARLLAWYGVHRRDLPWRRTADPYAVLVSEIMLQQTQASRVVAKFESWMSTFPSLETLASAQLSEVLQLWSGLGYNNRAQRLLKCAAEVVAPAAGGSPATLPRTIGGLQALPGIGPYTARAVLIFAHNDDLAAVDANIRRVLTHELDLDERLSAGAVQAIADAVLPRGRSRDWHNALMDYGALVLTARATGIAPRSRQGVFEGSRRWYRSRLLRTLLDDGPQTVDGLPGKLGVAAAVAQELVALLEHDGLVRREGDVVRVA